MKGRLLLAFLVLAATAAGWRRAARAVRHHRTARMHALAKLPALVAGGHSDTALSMLRLALTPTRPAPRERTS